MRRQESRRGATVTDNADREGCSPEMIALEVADGFKTPAGNSVHGEKLQGQAVPVPPGIADRIEPDTTIVLTGGDPVIGAEHCAPSDKSKQRGRGQR